MCVCEEMQTQVQASLIRSSSPFYVQNTDL